MLFFLAIGVLVYRRGPSNPINITFSLSCLFIAIWVTVGIIWKVQIQLGILPDLISRMGVATGCLVTASLLSFSGYFPIKSRKLSTGLLLINYLIAVLIALSAFTPLSVAQAYFQDGKFIRVFGPLYLLFAAYVIGGTLSIIVIMVRKHQRLTHILDKQKIKYVTFGMVISLMLVIIFMFVLPYFDYYQLFFLGQIAPLIMVSFSAFAIVRYHALDISALASRVIVWICHLIIVALTIHTVVAATRPWLNDQNNLMVTFLVLLALAMVMVYWIYLRPLIDQLILHKVNNTARVLEEFSQELNVLKPMDELTDDIRKFMQRTFRVDHVSIYYHHLDHYNQKYQPATLNQQDLVICQPFLDYIQLYDNVLELEQIELDPKYQAIKETAMHYFKMTSAQLVLPLVFNKKLLGVLNLGRKQASGGIDSNELQLLAILRHDISVALNNSKLYQQVNDLYERVRQLNETLEERVAERTVELEDALNQLQHLDRLKSDFISVASHELRTPLTSVKGAIALALEYKLTGQVGKAVSHLLDMSHRNIDRLIQLINDILDLSKLEANQSELVMNFFDVDEIVTSAIESLTALAEEKQLTIASDLPGVRLRVYGDLSRLQQVMINILGNAIKFSPVKGTIHINVKQDQGQACCSVTDQGDGIAVADQQRIFDKFSQIEDTRIKQEGSGLGLAISKKKIEKHGGTIWVSSIPGQGATFSFTLPVKKIDNQCLE